MRRVVVLCLPFLYLGCSSGGPSESPYQALETPPRGDETPGTAPEPDQPEPPDYPVEPPPVEPACAFDGVAPSEGAFSGNIQLTAWGEAPETTVTATVLVTFGCDSAEPIVEMSTSWSGGTASWTWDASGAESGEYCVRVTAPGCDSVEPALFVVDNDCPQINVTSPGEAFLGTMDISLLIGDLTGIADVRVESADELLLAELIGQVDEHGDLAVESALDVSAWPTGPVDAVVRATDLVGNTCTTALPGSVVAAPSFVSARRVDSSAGAATFIQVRDIAPADGSRDVVAATGSGVAVYRNDGTGGLKPGVLVEGIAGPTSYVLADDLSGDGQPDLIVVQQGPDGDELIVYTFGEAGYTAAETHALGTAVTALWYGRFTSSDRDILVGGGDDPRALGVLRSTGGTEPFFEPIAWSAGPAGIRSIVVADFVDDGSTRKDIMVARAPSPTLSIFRHDIGGVIKGVETVTLPVPAVQILPAVLDGDLYMDAVLVMEELGQLWHVFGTGDGHLREALNPDTLSAFIERRAICIEGAPAAAVMHFLDDELTVFDNHDLVVANRATGTLWTLFGDGLDAGYSKRWIVDVAPKPTQVRLSDLNYDGFTDAVSLSQGGALSVLLGTGPDGRFSGAYNVTTPIPGQAGGALHRCNESSQAANGAASLGTPDDRLSPEWMAVAQFDSDGAEDLVIVGERTLNLNPGPDGPPAIPIITYATGGLGATTPTSISQMSPFMQDGILQKGPVVAVEVGSFDLDFTADLVVATNTPDPASIDLLLNKDDGGFVQLSTDLSATPNAVDVAVIHCNGIDDYLSDVAVIGELLVEGKLHTELTVLRALPTGTLTTAFTTLFPEESRGRHILATRLGGTGDPSDLLIATADSVRVFRGVEDFCEFTNDGALPVGSDIQGLAAGDLNSDGLPDIVAPLADGFIAVALNDGLQGFSTPVMPLQIPGGSPSAPALADINGDGLRDITVLRANPPAVVTFLAASPDGEFLTTPWSLPTPVNPTTFLLKDLNDDGCVELLTMSQTTKAVSVAQNRVGEPGQSQSCPELSNLSP